jgi:hypothetical protein
VDFRITSTALCQAELQRHDHLVIGYHKVSGNFRQVYTPVTTGPSSTARSR